MRKEELRDAFEIARFGITVEQFMLSPVGKYLINRAEMDRDKAIDDFKKVDSNDAQAVRAVQDRICTPDKIVKWLTEAIEGGRSAQDAIEETEANQE
jgi:hypothetical protein